MSLCFSYSISSSFTSTKGCLLFSTASNCTLPSPRSSLSSSSVSQLVSSSTSFVRSFFYFVIRARKYISRNMSPISYDVFNFTFKVFPLPGSSHSPFNFPDFRHFEKLSILESYFRHLCNSPFRFLCRLLSCLSHIYVSLILFVSLSLYRFSKIQISKFLIIVSTRSLEKSPMTSNDRSI